MKPGCQCHHYMKPVTQSHRIFNSNKQYIYMKPGCQCHYMKPPRGTNKNKITNSCKRRCQRRVQINLTSNKKGTRATDGDSSPRAARRRRRSSSLIKDLKRRGCLRAAGRGRGGIPLRCTLLRRKEMATPPLQSPRPFLLANKSLLLLLLRRRRRHRRRHHHLLPSMKCVLHLEESRWRLPRRRRAPRETCCRHTTGRGR
jgi:hypothetical protein